MGTYAAKADMIERFGEREILQLTDKHEPGTGAIDEAVLDRALEDADGAIDAALQARYTLPLATVPKILKRYACDLARYHLYGDGASDGVRKRYEDALKFLREVSAGTLNLGADSAGAEVEATDSGPQFGDSRRVMGADEDGAREYG